MKKVLALILVLAMILAFAGCGAKKDSGNAKDTLNVAFTQDRGTLDPAYNIGYDSLNAVRLCYDGLWEWNSKGEQQWILCTGIDMNEDGTEWTLHIREGVKFSNGNPLTAEDVVFSLDKNNHRTGEPDYLPNLDLENTYAKDDYTVVMKLTQYDLSYIYSMTCLMIFDKESYDADKIAQEPIGTGPYKIKEYVVNSHISFERREDYWGEKPDFKYINFKIYTEESQRTNAIITGEVDVCAVPFQDIEYVKEKSPFEVVTSSAAQGLSRALYFNITEYGQLAGNEEGRQAIAYAIDNQAILDIVYGGYGSVACMPCSVYCNDTRDSFKGKGVYADIYNVEKAQKMAEEAGIVGKTFTISTNGSSDAILCAENIQADLEKIGVHTEIKNYDPGSWLSVAFVPEAAGDMFIDSTGVPSKTVSQNISCWYLYHLGGGFTTSEFNHKERLDEISAIIMSVPDEEERAAMNQELVDIESEVLHWYNICDRVSAFGYNKNLTGFEIMVMGNINYTGMHWTNN